MPSDWDRLDALQRAKPDVKAATGIQCGGLADRFGVQMREVDRTMDSIDDTIGDPVYEIETGLDDGSGLMSSIVSRLSKTEPEVQRVFPAVRCATGGGAGPFARLPESSRLRGAASDQSADKLLPPMNQRNQPGTRL